MFAQDVCEGTCFSEEEVINITNNIKELEFELEKIKEIDLFEINWPIFPLVREEIVKSKKTITVDAENKKIIP